MLVDCLKRHRLTVLGADMQQENVLRLIVILSASTTGWPLTYYSGFRNAWYS